MTDPKAPWIDIVDHINTGKVPVAEYLEELGLDGSALDHLLKAATLARYIKLRKEDPTSLAANESFKAFLIWAIFAQNLCGCDFSRQSQQSVSMTLMIRLEQLPQYSVSLNYMPFRLVTILDCLYSSVPEEAKNVEFSVCHSEDEVGWSTTVDGESNYKDEYDDVTCQSADQNMLIWISEKNQEAYVAFEYSVVPLYFKVRWVL